MGNFASKGGSHSAGTKQSGAEGSGLASYVAQLIDQTLTWQDIAWLRKNTKMKIVVKGVMTVEDAIASVKNGVDGIWVSNHGPHIFSNHFVTVIANLFFLSIILT